MKRTTISNIPPLPAFSAEKQEELCLRAQQGDKEAEELMVRSNAGLVSKFARQYARPGVDADDLFSCGIMALLRAIRGFTPGMGAVFSTYAARAITTECARESSMHARPVRLPAHATDTMSQFRITARRMELKTGTHPTFDEVCDRIGLDENSRGWLRDAIETAARPIEPFLDEYHNLSRDHVSEYDDQEERTVFLNRLLARTLPEDRVVMRRIYGIHGAEQVTLRVIARSKGVAFQRIGQRRKRALDTMRCVGGAL
jgi:RNA polymerase primary sigma factor